MNTNNEGTFHQTMRRGSVGRHSFPKYCSFATTSLGLGAGMTPKITWALENRPRIPVAWTHGLECTCCTGSFIRSFRPPAKDVILFLISLDYDDTLVAVTGTQAEEVFEDVLSRYHGRYILTIEGNPPLGEQGILCISSRRPFVERLKGTAVSVSAVIAWGTCASWDCVQIARPSPAQATPIDKVITDKPIAEVPSYPPILDIMNAITTYLVAFGRLPELDRPGCPLMLYGQYIHDRYYRRAHFDAGEPAESWDDNVARQGYCLYKMGYKEPATYSACSTTCWSGGVSLLIQPGHGCLGCSENGSWDRGSFYGRMAGIPQVGVHPTVDTVGLTTPGVVATGAGIHAVASVINQHHRYKQ